MISFALKPYKSIPLTKEIALAAEMEIFILDNFPGPILIKILFISSKLVLFFFKKHESRVINLSKFSLLFEHVVV